MDWAQILVIILSVFLALFLLLAIVLVSMLIKLTKQIKDVTDSAKRTANGIENIVGGVSKFTSPGLLVSLISKRLKVLKKSKKK